MDHSLELLHQAFAVFLFCIAVTILFIGYRSYITVLNTTNKIINNEVIYEQYNKVEDNLATKGEIVTLLFNQLEYDIEIDGVLISKSENVKENISTYIITDSMFLKSYAYDSKGNITRIIFTKL